MDGLTPARPDVPMTVTAHLQAGAALPPMFPLPLDGLLAWQQIRRDRPDLAQVPLRAEQPPVEVDLPLARHTTSCGEWVWQASCAVPDQDGEHPVWWHRRFPYAAAHRAARIPPKIRANNQRYASRQALLVTVCSTLTWHGVGDPDAVRVLLAGVHGVGKKRASGHGAVLAWHVDPAPRADTSTWGLAAADGGPARPLPTVAGPADEHDPDLTGATIVAGARPPYWHPATLRRVAAPGQPRQEEAAT